MRQIRRGIRRHAAPLLIGLAIGMVFSSTFFTSPARRRTSSLASPQSSLFDLRPEYDLVVVILSSVGYTDRRHAIRDSWLSMKSSPVAELAALSSRVKPLFVIGNRRQEPGVLDAAQTEGDDHGDILFVDSADDFDSLTSKVVKAYEHISDNYRAKYVLKVDDDSYVNLPALVSELASKPEEKFYWGYFQGRANVKKQGKYEEGGWFLCDRFVVRTFFFLRERK
jgi:galactosylxylosylprotein 3-beta-galactosyltransferase